MTAVMLGLSAGLVASHVAMSHPVVADPLRARLGAMGFQGVYSLVSMLFFAPLAWMWWFHPHAGALVWSLRTHAFATHLAEALVVLGFAITSAGALASAPTSMTSSARGRDHLEVRGITGLTRHPVSMGIGLLAVGHLVENGWMGDIAFWGSLLGLAVFGTLHQDWRKRREWPAYDDFARRTTWLPVPKPSTLTTLTGRAAAGLALGAAVAVVVRYFHAGLFGG